MVVKKVVVSARAVLQRVNRKLAAEEQKLCKHRGLNQHTASGNDYFLLDIYQNRVIDLDVQLDHFARKLKVLGEWESIAK